MRGRVAHRDDHRGPRLGCRLALPEEQRPLVDRAHVAVGLLHVHPPFVAHERDATRRVEVVVQSLALDVGHAARRADGAFDPDRRHVRGNVERVAVGQDDVVLVTPILEDARQVEADAARVPLLTEEPDAVEIGLPRRSTRPVEHVQEALVLGSQRIGTGEPDLASQLHGALQRELGLLQHQHIVVRLEWDLRSASARECGARRPDVAARSIALEKVGRVNWRPDRVRQAARRAVRREAGDLHVPEVRSDLGTPRQTHEFPQRHAFLPGIAPGLVDHACDRHVERTLEWRNGVHDDRIAIVERERRHEHAARVLVQGGARTAVLSTVLGSRSSGPFPLGPEGQRDIHRGPGDRPRRALGRG